MKRPNLQFIIPLLVILTFNVLGDLGSIMAKGRDQGNRGCLKGAITGEVLFLVGEVKLDDQTLKRGVTFCREGKSAQLTVNEGVVKINFIGPERTVTVFDRTQLQLDQGEQVHLQYGSVRFNVARLLPPVESLPWPIETPNGRFAVKGTEFLVIYRPTQEETHLVVFNGIVLAGLKNSQEEKRIPSSHQIIIKGTKRPTFVNFKLLSPPELQVYREMSVKGLLEAQRGERGQASGATIN